MDMRKRLKELKLTPVEEISKEFEAVFNRIIERKMVEKTRSMDQIRKLFNEGF